MRSSFLMADDEDAARTSSTGDGATTYSNEKETSDVAASRDEHTNSSVPFLKALEGFRQDEAVTAGGSRATLGEVIALHMNFSSSECLLYRIDLRAKKTSIRSLKNVFGIGQELYNASEPSACSPSLSSSNEITTTPWISKPPSVHFALQSPPLSRGEVASRKSSTSHSPLFATNTATAYIVPQSIAAFPQNFTPLSKASPPKLRAMTPSPPIPCRSQLSEEDLERLESQHRTTKIDSSHETRSNYSLLEPRGPFHRKENRDPFSPPQTGFVSTPESEIDGPRDDQDYTRRLNVCPGVRFQSFCSAITLIHFC